MEIKPGQIWKHYKGNDYKIIILGKHSETAEDMVVYEQMHSGKIYIRPMHLFFNQVEWESKMVPRFVLVDDKMSNMNKYLLQSIIFIVVGMLAFIFSPHINAVMLTPFKDLGLMLLVLGLATYPFIFLGSLVLVIVGLVKLRKYFKYKKNA